MKKFLGIMLLGVSLFSGMSYADKPTCHSSSGGYCRYTGYVESIYVNSGELILFYFDTSFGSASEIDVAGFSASQTGAAIVSLDAEPEFGRLFYSTALAAQASGRKVTIQMRGSLSGYPKADRIWLAR